MSNSYILKLFTAYSYVETILWWKKIDHGPRIQRVKNTSFSIDDHWFYEVNSQHCSLPTYEDSPANDTDEVVDVSRSDTWALRAYSGISEGSHSDGSFGTVLSTILSRALLDSLLLHFLSSRFFIFRRAVLSQGSFLILKLVSVCLPSLSAS